ncbi:MAG: ABC transporter permease, partial [Sedimentisphaerales bacterium]|nr:ABC transporter permease [Sedimentisphaerales bacterium]
GAKVSMTVGFMANIIAVPIGMALGMIGGYFGKWIDDFVFWLYTTWASIPGLILLIAIKFAFQNVGVLFKETPIEIDMTGIHGLYIALGIRSWIGTCRIVRAETFKLRELDYVTAARALGQGHLRIIFRHIAPNLLHLGIISFTLGFVGAVTAEVMLSFLGLGVPVGTPSWGSMINAARLDLVVGRWWEVTAACGAMFFLVLALNLFGDRLRDALDPKLRTA